MSGIENRAAYAKRHLWWMAKETAEPILEGLRALAGVERAEVAGGLRRLKETVGDLDFIVASKEPGPVMDWFTGLPDVGRSRQRDRQNQACGLLRVSRQICGWCLLSSLRLLCIISRDQRSTM